MKSPVYLCFECGNSFYIELEKNERRPDSVECDDCGGVMEWCGFKDEVD